MEWPFPDKKLALRGLGTLIPDGKDGTPLYVWRWVTGDSSGKGIYRGALFDPKRKIWYQEDNTEIRRMRHPAYNSEEGRELYSFLRQSGMDPDKALELAQDTVQPPPEIDFAPSEFEALTSRAQQQFMFGFPSKYAAESWVNKKWAAWLRERRARLIRVPAKKVYLSRSGRQLIFVPWEETYKPPPTNFMWIHAQKQERLRKQEEEYAKWRKKFGIDT